MNEMKKEQAYKYIKQQILQGTWTTNKAINVNKVIEELKISRTPVNKALRQLENEGFLNIIPQVGVFVKQPDEREVYERLLVCAQLDSLMTGHAAMEINNQTLEKLEKTLIKMEDPNLSNEQYGEMNIMFHSQIIYSSGLQYMIDMTKQLWDYLNYVNSPNELFYHEVRKRSQIEHWMIYHSLQERDSDMAKKVMEKHMARVAEYFRRSLIDK